MITETEKKYCEFSSLESYTNPNPDAIIVFTKLSFFSPFALLLFSFFFPLPFLDME